METTNKQRHLATTNNEENMNEQYQSGKSKKSTGGGTEKISLISVICCIAVVYMHLGWFHGVQPQLTTNWILSLIIEKVFVFAVPVFFMISGTTLLNYTDRYDDITFFKKRIKKVVIPWIAWSFISFLYCFIFNRDEIGSLNLLDIFDGIINNKYRSIYWFFPVLISVYLCIPLFANIDKNRRRVFEYLVLAGLIFNIVLPDFGKILNINMPIGVPVVAEYLIYVLIGWLIFYNQEQYQRLYPVIYFAGLSALLIQLIGTTILSLSIGVESRVFRDCNTLNFLYSISIWSVCVNYGDFFLKNKIVRKIVDMLKAYTLPIYLIHQFANNLVQKVFEFCGVIVEGTILYQLFGPILVIMISVLVARILRKIPYLRRIVP